MTSGGWRESCLSMFTSFPDSTVEGGSMKQPRDGWPRVDQRRHPHDSWSGGTPILLDAFDPKGSTASLCQSAPGRYAQFRGLDFLTVT